MEDSFDDLDVPDNWLEIASKRSLEDTEESRYKCSKKPKLSATSKVSSNGVFSSLEASSTNHLETSSETETIEDISVNEPDFNVNEDDCSYEVDSTSSAIGQPNEIHEGNPGELKWSPDDRDSLTQANSFSHDTNSGLVNGNRKSVQEELDRTKCLKNDIHHLGNRFCTDSERKPAIGYSSSIKYDNPLYLKSASEKVLPESRPPEESASFEEKNWLNKSLSVVEDAKIISRVLPNKDFNEICKLLEEQKDKNNRLQLVTYQLITAFTEDMPSVVDIFEEVQQVVKAVPSANANEVYEILEQLPPSSNRVQNVITKLSSGILNGIVETLAYPDPNHAEVNDIVPLSDDLLLENDPLLEDMRTVAKMFPEKDRNEIYALLEANFKQENRVEAVINEILRTETNEATQQSLPIDSAYDSVETISYGDIEDGVGQDMKKMRNIFPDCDPNYLYEKLDAMKNKPNRTEILVAELFEKRDYPKLKDLLAKEKEKEKINKARHLVMTPKEFLEKFQEPLKTFTDKTKEMSDIYKQHSEVLLKNDFPNLKSSYLSKIIRKHNGHLYPAYNEISTQFLKIPLEKRTQSKIFLKEPRPVKLPMLENADEYFYHELWFVYNELSVTDYIKDKKLERELKMKHAREAGELFECCCCYDDECLLEDLATCPEGHLFCKTCVVRSTEAAFGEMKTKFPCLTGECDKDLPLSYLQKIIPANLFSKIVRRLQEEEVQQAGIPDLVSCPFCPFAAIMTNPDDKVFKCLNPDCLKESCRLCQEPNHIPLRCNEVEKTAETNMRVYIENKISEAVMRKCHKCGKRFVKEAGCNKMTCVCGATSCYACKATNIDYEHFNNNQKCANTDPKTIHEQDMKEAAFQAKQQYLLDHPEAAQVELKTDVHDMIKNFNKSKEKRHRTVDNEDISDDESLDSADDDDVYDGESFDSDDSDDVDPFYSYDDRDEDDGKPFDRADIFF